MCVYVHPSILTNGPALPSFQASYPTVAISTNFVFKDSSAYENNATLEAVVPVRGLKLSPTPMTPPCPYQLSPTQVYFAGGQDVTIRGSNFARSPFLRCKFDESQVPARFVSHNEIVCSTPSLDKGCASVVEAANGYPFSGILFIFAFRFQLDGKSLYII